MDEPLHTHRARSSAGTNTTDARRSVAFCRATFYRWAQLCRTCRRTAARTRVLAVGTCNVDSFGTWRDVEGRLWLGVDDFDEAYLLPSPAISFRLRRPPGS